MIRQIVRDIRKNLVDFKNVLYHRIYTNPAAEKDIVSAFHKLYYDANAFGKTWGDTYWLGVQTCKCPLDLWIYQEIVYQTRPELIIECGTNMGGSALFLASMCDLVKTGKVITIDIEEKKNRPAHERIAYITGSSVSEEVVSKVRGLASGKERVMVVLDSDHRKEHVLNELILYKDFVNTGGYLIVEDTNINGHPVNPGFGPGPMEAVREFLDKNKDFIIDESKEKFYLTFSPRGYLKRIKKDSSI